MNATGTQRHGSGTGLSGTVRPRRPIDTARLRRATRTGLTLIAACVAALALAGCTGDGDSGDGVESPPGATADASDSGGTVSNQNANGAATPLDSSANDALAGAAPLDIADWTVEPVIEAGALTAEGTLEPGAILFNPMGDEGYAFAVHYKGQDEPLVVLLPDLGPLYSWDTTLTIAPTKHEIEGTAFWFRAYSPLFMDVGPGDLELRLFGFDASGEPAVLAVREIAVR